MAKKRFLLGILVIVLVFNMIFLSCGGNNEGNNENTLNGTWDSESGWGYKFNNGNVEYLEGSDLGFVDSKGTFSTIGGNLIMTFKDYTLTFPYSVNGNQLTLTNEDGSKQTLIKKGD